MAGQALEIRQGQSLVMTQRLQQSIKMLQMPSHELQQFVDAEIQENPLLSMAEPSDEPSDTPAENSEFDEGDQSLRSLDTAEEDWWGGEASMNDSTYAQASDRSRREDLSATESIEQRHSEELSLREHLSAQAGALLGDPADRLIGEALIDLIDDSGYLTEDTAVLEAMLGVEPEAVERVIGVLQQMEPTGVFARSLTECLRLQLEDRQWLTRSMRALLDHLPLIASGEMKKLQKLTGLDEDGLKEALCRIRLLDPKPGAAFDSHPAVTLIPDVIVRKRAGIGWQAELNPEALPKVLLNRDYHQTLLHNIRNKSDKKFISEQFNNASWLIKALEQRAGNTLKVAAAMVEWQKDFFELGIRYLQPMKLADIAEKAGVHESTVSRIASGKSIASPRGIFEMKYFYSGAVGGESGDALSSRIIMHEIAQLVAKEAGDILSDDAIMRMLKDKGIDVARRTVVKYRSILGIGSSVDRRRARNRH